MTYLRAATILPLVILAMEVEAADRTNNRCFVGFEPIASSSRDAPPQRRFWRRFSAQEMLDLRVDVWFRATNHSGLVEIKLYTPAGRLYEVLHAKAGPDDARPIAHRRRLPILSARLPVAGSHITSRSLYGTWTAEVFLDGSDEPCTRRPRRFFIEP